MLGFIHGFNGIILEFSLGFKGIALGFIGIIRGLFFISKKAFLGHKGFYETINLLELLQRNWVFATNSNFLIPISWQPDGENPWYFILRIFDQTEFIV